MLYTNQKKSGSAKGLEYLQNVRHFTTRNELGQTVDNYANLTDNAGNALPAYTIAPGTGAGDAILGHQRGGMSRDERWTLIETLRKRGIRVDDDISDQELVNLAISSSTEGLATVDDLGGNHNGGILTKVGTDNKSTPNVRQGGAVWANNVPGEFARNAGR